MRVSECNWLQIEDYLKHDNRAVVPLGSTEQHAYLSLSVDSILSERVAAEAAEPLGVPVFPVVAYGITPYFRAYPGTISISLQTYAGLIRDILDGLYSSGFRRITLCNGHGGNSPAQTVAMEWMGSRQGAQVRLHNWWNAPKTFAKVQAIDQVASHASWMENFPWTRLANIRGPAERKPMIDLERMRIVDPAGVRQMLGDGNFGGYYQRSDEEMLTIWEIAVAETRAIIEGPWS